MRSAARCSRSRGSPSTSATAPPGPPREGMDHRRPAGRRDRAGGQGGGGAGLGGGGGALLAGVRDGLLRRGRGGGVGCGGAPAPGGGRRPPRGRSGPPGGPGGA